MFARLSLLVLLVVFSPLIKAQEVETENIPGQILQIVELGAFAQLYAADGSINPFYLRGDFDGDGKPDYAIRVKSRTGAKSGIAIWLSSQARFAILGAGVPFKVSGSLVSSIDILNCWQVYGKRNVERGVEAGTPPHLLGEAIVAGKCGSASGLIYWNGESFVWYQQGD